MNIKFNEWWSTQRAKNPGKVVLGVILLFNILFFLFAAAVISAFSLDGTEHMGFMEAAFCTLIMILDAGGIQFVVADIGQTGVFISLFCLGVILVGMISFTGAVIGYVTNYISHFIENANAGKHKIYLSNHIVILNWNSRASEIINDYLYNKKKQKIVVLVGSRKNEIHREIEERLTDTIERENRKIEKEFAHLPYFAKRAALRKHRFVRNITVLVREGDVFSSKQLQDISLERARSIIILGNDINNSMCKFEQKDVLDRRNRGNSQTIKTLMQVADITAAVESADNQKIIVEITDDATWELVNKIIKSKQVDGKCDIVPVRVNQVLGQILSQFSLMPELNRVYEELFSNRGAEVYTCEQPVRPMGQYAKQYLDDHKKAIPLNFMTHNGVDHCFYMADEEVDISDREKSYGRPNYRVDLNRDYWIERKNVVILGHNSKSRDIMIGFQSFCNEWNRSGESILNIVVVDDQKNLERMNYYREYPFVVKTVAADIFDEALICQTIEEFVASNAEDTSILILSDDAVANEDIDANALAHLIYVQEIINRKRQNPDWDPGRIDVVVEIIDPKHHDIVNSYSVNNVVISNRYISKMIAQIGEVDALFDFYVDILSYDEADVGKYESKEIYAKKVSRYFNTVPDSCTAAQLIRAVLEATIDETLPPEEQDPTFVIGHVAADGTVRLFAGNQDKIEVNITEKDKLIVFSSH